MIAEVLFPIFTQRCATHGALARLAQTRGARTIYVDPEEPANRAFFDTVLLGKAAEVPCGSQ